MKLNTVNVVEVIKNASTYIHAFDNDLNGALEALETLKRCILEDMPDMKKEDVEACLDDGEYLNGEYSVSLMRSVIV